jgi:hypothetical protein
VVERAGHHPFSSTFELDPGARVTIHADLRPETGPPPPLAKLPARSWRADPDPGPSAHRSTAWATGGTSLVAIVAGIGVAVAARSTDADLTALCNSAGAECPASAQAEQLRARRRTQSGLANVSFGIAGAAALATGVILMLDQPTPRALPPPGDDSDLLTLRIEPLRAGALVSAGGAF